MITQQNLTTQIDQNNHLPQENSVCNTNSQIMNTVECRICLQTLTRSSKAISPCKCSGSIKYVHFKCMSQWICRNVQRPLHESFQRDRFPCEMCKQPIIFDTQASIQCISCAQLKQKIRAAKLLFFGLLFLSIGLFLILCYCIYASLASEVINLSDQKWFQSVLVIFSLFLGFCIQLVATYFFVKNFFWTFNIFIVKIYSCKATTRSRSDSMWNSSANLMHVSRNNRVVHVEPIIQNIE